MIARYRPALALLGICLALAITWELVKTVFGLTKITLPHLWEIVAAFINPARRNGPPLFGVLLEASLFTMRGALAGFVLGALLGLVLGIVFAHVTLLERAFVPFVVASQTIPILDPVGPCYLFRWSM